MRKTNFAAGITISTLLMGVSATAFAQTAPDILNEQINMGDVFADMDVVVDGDHNGNVGSTALATGNAASGLDDGATDGQVESDQTMSGEATAIATLSGGRVFGTSSADATAYGNSTTGSQYQPDRLDQTVTVDSTISSTANVSSTTANTINASATSAANIHDLTYTMGTVNANADQVSNADVSATVNADVCCSVDDTNANALAVNNSYQASSTYSSAFHNVQQDSANGTVSAATNLVQPNGNNISANAQAMGNNVVADNTWGYSQLDGSQTNSSTIEAETIVELADWDGTASISAYGVGNSAMQTNVGSDLNAYYTQTNSGDVTSLTGFEGGNGGAGNLTTSSTAIGNTYTGYVCATCQSATPGGYVSQTNSGNVVARGQAWAGSSGNVYGSAAAIGNSANYSTNNAGGD
ncbi:holdfast anchor protein HfaD [Hirschia maritima]|uniref:holdfast anchor protein HfaD n=1 Tax=Hirschia maritima TaxID=1121961 RepID=UPI00037FCFFE|nr:holdfast anchor protein HfaD [Hirschia maritima]